MEREHTFFRPRFRGHFIGCRLLYRSRNAGSAHCGGPVRVYPVDLVFVLVWMFMLATALLVVEVNLWFKEGCQLFDHGREDFRALWPNGFRVCYFLFLFYCLMVAYIAGGGSSLLRLAGSAI